MIPAPGGSSSEYNVARSVAQTLRRLCSGTSEAAICFDDGCSLLESRAEEIEQKKFSGGTWLLPQIAAKGRPEEVPEEVVDKGGET